MTNSRRHILHVTFDMGIGGAEQVITQLIHGLDSQLYTSSVFCIETPVGAFGQKLKTNGVKVFSGNRKPKLDWHLIKKIRTVIQQEHIDIVHCHQYTPYIYGLFASFFSPAKVVFTEHGRFYPDIPSTKRRCINPLLNLLTQSITSISEATKVALVEVENFKANTIEVIYNGISDLKETRHSDELRNQLGINNSDIVLGTISRLDPIKNQVLMIRAFAQLHKKIPNARLLVVGDGPLREDLHALAKQLDLTQVVVFTGFIVEPQPYLNIMDIYLLPSLSEGTSMTLLEAMSLGKPCVVTNAGGNPEIIQDQVCGLVTPNDDLEAFTLAIERMTQDQQLRQSYGKQARKIFESKFSLEQMTLSFEALYKKLISSNKSS